MKCLIAIYSEGRFVRLTEVPHLVPFMTIDLDEQMIQMNVQHTSLRQDGDFLAFSTERKTVPDFAPLLDYTGEYGALTNLTARVLCGNAKTKKTRRPIPMLY